MTEANYLYTTAVSAVVYTVRSVMAGTDCLKLQTGLKGCDYGSPLQQGFPPSP